MVRRAWVVAAAIVGLTMAAGVAAASHVFDDVPDTSVFHADITWLKDSGVTVGCNPPDDNLFCPKEKVSREQMAAFMHRLAVNQVVDAGFLGGVPPQGYLRSDTAPGVAQTIAAATTFLDGSVQTAASVDVDAPADGFVLAIGSAEVLLEHVTGTESTVRVGVSDAPGVYPSAQDKAATVDPTVASGDFRMTIASQQIFPVTAGSHTFYLLAERRSGSNGEVNDQILSAVYFPSSYGVVDGSPLGSSAGSDG